MQYSVRVVRSMKVLIIFGLAALAATAEGGTARITNGQTVPSGTLPYLASLLIHKNNGYVICGGSLIGTGWIVTAAHCVDGATDVTVGLGSSKRSSPQLNLNVPGSKVILHPDWNKANVHNDIALVQIPTVNYTTQIKNIRLPTTKLSIENYAGKKAVISGWGGLSDGSLPDVAQYATVQIMSQRECGKTLDLIDSMLCVSTAVSSVCGGDSGGPLALSTANILVGVISFTVGGCNSGYPAGFSRITSFLWWIEKHTGIYY